MKWSDVARILYGPIPQPDSVPHGIGTVHLSEELQTVLKQVETFLYRSSEAEAAIRVLFMVIAAIPDTGGIQLRLQPSISGHSKLTDFLFLATDDTSDWPLTFIEVKRFSDSADLNVPYQATAQTYREAQILLCESDWARKGLKEIGFILSNSTVWSFARAKRHLNRISIMNKFTMYTPESRGRILFCLRSLLSGQWPLPESTSSEESSTSSREPSGEPSTSPHVGPEAERSPMASTAAPQ